MKTLFLISTPIGNLKDITLRAIEVLKKVDLILCEDTRQSGKLLKKYKIRKDKKPQLLPYHDHNKLKQIPNIIKFLEKDKKVALITDAGTPIIADPGFKLIKTCLKRKIKIESIPGPSSLITALILSGQPPDKFLFLGYLPKKRKKRRQLLGSLSKTTKGNINHLTFIAFESPHRLLKSLKDILLAFGNINIAVCREMTKLNQQIIRKKIKETIIYFEKNKPLGEIVLVFSSKK